MTCSFVLFASMIGHSPFPSGIFFITRPIKRYFFITTAFKMEAVCSFETLLSISRKKWCRSVGYDTIPQFRVTFRFLQNPRSFSLHSYFSFISFYLFFLPFVDMQSATQEYMCIKWEHILFVFKTAFIHSSYRPNPPPDFQR